MGTRPMDKTMLYDECSRTMPRVKHRMYTIGERVDKLRARWRKAIAATYHQKNMGLPITLLP